MNSTHAAEGYAWWQILYVLYLGQQKSHVWSLDTGKNFDLFKYSKKKTEPSLTPKYQLHILERELKKSVWNHKYKVVLDAAIQLTLYFQKELWKYSSKFF